MRFEVLTRSSASRARRGRLTLTHGVVETPVFMPVGTQGVVKTLSPWELEEIGTTIILGNTYHLHLRPGDELIKSQGGLHTWSSWSKPILTDSGGYQAFSLARSTSKLAKITDAGVRFYSHFDGRKIFFTSESVIDIQANLGSDIVMVLDDCAPYPATERRLSESVQRTYNWARRSIDYHQTLGTQQALFGIIQGGMNQELRKQSADRIQSLPFQGIAIGGVSVGEGKENMRQVVDIVAPHLDSQRPHYLMGVGEPDDLIRMVAYGIDMFDCVIATRLARHGSFWSGQEYRRKAITHAEFEQDTTSLDPSCRCRICRSYSKSYLRHLYMVREPLAARALSYHNLWVIHRLMERIRQSIEQNQFEEVFSSYLGS